MASSVFPSSGSPVDATYVTATANSTLTAERVLTDGTNTTVDTATPGQIKVNAAGGNPFDQDLNTTDAVTFASVNTGQGANELYDMNQNVLTTSDVVYASVSVGTGPFATTGQSRVGASWSWYGLDGMAADRQIASWDGTTHSNFGPNLFIFDGFEDQSVAFAMDYAGGASPDIHIGLDPTDEVPAIWPASDGYVGTSTKPWDRVYAEALLAPAIAVTSSVGDVTITAAGDAVLSATDDVFIQPTDALHLYVGGNITINDTPGVTNGNFSKGLLTTDFTVPVSGTYAPTFTNVANLDGTPTAATDWQYARVGNVVTVSGEMTIDPTTTATTTQAGISLPVASDFASAGQCAGTGASPGVAGQCMAVIGDATNNRAELKWKALDVTSQVTAVTFSYLVV